MKSVYHIPTRAEEGSLSASDLKFETEELGLVVLFYGKLTTQGQLFLFYKNCYPSGKEEGIKYGT